MAKRKCKAIVPWVDLDAKPSESKPVDAERQGKGSAKRKLTENQRRALLQHQFQPGKSGNPGGMVKGSVSLTGLLRKYLAGYAPDQTKQRAQQFIEKIYDQAMAGDKVSQQLIANYVDGKPHTRIELTGADGGSISHVVYDLSALPLAKLEELAVILEEAERPALEDGEASADADC